MQRGRLHWLNNQLTQSGVIGELLQIHAFGTMDRLKHVHLGPARSAITPITACSITKGTVLRVGLIGNSAAGGYGHGLEKLYVGPLNLSMPSIVKAVDWR